MCRIVCGLETSKNEVASAWLGLLCQNKKHTLHTVWTNTETVLVASEGICLYVIAEKTKWMVMGRDQNAGQERNIKGSQYSVSKYAKVANFGVTRTKYSSSYEEIKAE